MIIRNWGEASHDASTESQQATPGGARDQGQGQTRRQAGCSSVPSTRHAPPSTLKIISAMTIRNWGEASHEASTESQQATRVLQRRVRVAFRVAGGGWRVAGRRNGRGVAGAERNWPGWGRGRCSRARSAPELSMGSRVKAAPAIPTAISTARNPKDSFRRGGVWSSAGSQVDMPVCRGSVCSFVAAR
jgi:hypothetical protein